MDIYGVTQRLSWNWVEIWGFKWVCRKERVCWRCV